MAAFGGRIWQLCSFRSSEVDHIGNDMGKCLGQKDRDYFWEVAPNQRWLQLEV